MYNDKNTTPAVKAETINRLTSHEVKELFSDDRNVEFGVSIFETTPPELEELYEEERQEWQPKPLPHPAMHIFLTTCEDIKERLFAPSEIHAVVIGTEDYNAEYDAETLGFIAEEEETPGERDTTTEQVDNYLPHRWLQNQYATLEWSYTQLSPDERMEMSNQYKRLKKYLLLRATCVGLKLERDRWFSHCRDYLLAEEEDDLFGRDTFSATEMPSKTLQKEAKRKPPKRETESLSGLFLAQYKQALEMEQIRKSNIR